MASDYRGFAPREIPRRAHCGRYRGYCLPSGLYCPQTWKCYKRIEGVHPPDGGPVGACQFREPPQVQCSMWPSSPIRQYMPLALHPLENAPTNISFEHCLTARELSYAGYQGCRRPTPVVSPRDQRFPAGASPHLGIIRLSTRCATTGCIINRLLKNSLLRRDMDVSPPISHCKRLIGRSRIRACTGSGALKKGRIALFQQPVKRPVTLDYHLYLDPRNSLGHW